MQEHTSILFSICAIYLVYTFMSIYYIELLSKNEYKVSFPHDLALLILVLVVVFLTEDLRG